MLHKCASLVTCDQLFGNIFAAPDVFNEAKNAGVRLNISRLVPQCQQIVTCFNEKAAKKTTPPIWSRTARRMFTRERFRSATVDLCASRDTGVSISTNCEMFHRVVCVFRVSRHLRLVSTARSWIHIISTYERVQPVKRARDPVNASNVGTFQALLENPRPDKC